MTLQAPIDEEDMAVEVDVPRLLLSFVTQLVGQIRWDKSRSVGLCNFCCSVSVPVLNVYQI